MSRSFRIVSGPGQIPAVEALLAAEGYVFEPEPFSPFCRRLIFAPAPLGSSLAAFFGYIYIQDRSSMLPPLALAPGFGSAVLDMAASPGGKSGFLAQLAGESGMVLANEPSRERLATLEANLRRCNFLHAPTSSYGAENLPLAQESWPFILLDPPCSGWGTAEKNPRVMKIWRGEKIGRLTNLQRKMLAKAASLLAPGGTLLYSTCTTNPEENQEQTRFAMQELGLESVPIEPFPGFVFEQTQAGALLVDGQASGAQGFYLSRLRKKNAAVSIDAAAAGRPEHQTAAENGLPLSALAGPVFDPTLLPPGDAAVFGDKVRFLPAARVVCLALGFRWKGALLGRWQHGGFTPEPRLRACLPPPERGSALVLDEVEPIRRILAGASYQTGIKERLAAVWWRDLPLGTCPVRQGRLGAFWK